MVIKKICGLVISNKMNKTIIVKVSKYRKNKVYGKYIKKNIKLYVHDELNKCKKGDFVEVISSRPLSKKKCWILNKFISKK